MSKITFISHNALDNTLTFALDAVRYEYLLTPRECDTGLFLARKVSVGKAFAYVKANGTVIDNRGAAA